MLCAKFGWNWPSSSGEEDEYVKSLQKRRQWRWQQRGELKNRGKGHSVSESTGNITSNGVKISNPCNNWHVSLRKGFFLCILWVYFRKYEQPTTHKI